MKHQKNVALELIMANRKYFNQTYSAIMASLTYFAIGEVRSWSCTGVPSLQGKDGRNATLSQGPLPLEVTSWITSSPPLGAILSALIAGFVLQKLGRKKTMLLSVFLFLTAFLTLATSKIHEIPFVMIAARALMGCAVGFAMPSASIYVSEITDPKIRGILGSLPSVFMALGISYVYLLGTYTPWHYLAYFCCGVPLFAVIGICFVPESPTWLSNKGDDEEAEKASNWLNGVDKPKMIQPLTAKPSDASEKQFSALDKESFIEERIPFSFFAELKTKQVWHPFILCLLAMFFQQWSGVNVIVFNTVTVFSAANVTMDQYLATNIVGAVQLIATFMSVLVVDKAGRRVLLLLSGIGMAIPMASLGAFFYIFSGQTEADIELREQLEWVPLVCLILYMIGYSIGYACVPFLLLGEMLPGHMKNILGAFVSSFNLVMTFLVLKFFPTISFAIGFHGLFWLYAVISLIGGIFGYIFIPETKGKTLKQIESHFSGLNLLASLDEA